MSEPAPPATRPATRPATGPATGPARRRRWPARLGWALLAVVAALVFGVTTATANLSFGPHEARYEVTVDRTVTVDMGPLGTLELDSPLPLALGARVTVQEIPSGVDALEGVDTLTALSNDASSYLQFFTGPQAAIEDIARALVADALRRTVVALVLIGGGWLVLRAVIGAARRGDLHRSLVHNRGTVNALAATVLVVALAATVSVGRDRQAQVEATPRSTVFDGTPVEGLRVTGRLGGIIDTYGGLLIDAFRENQEFYQKADDALHLAWEEWAETQQDSTGGWVTAEPQPSGSPTVVAGEGEPTDPATDGATGPTDAATENPTSSPSVTEEDSEPVTMLVISDLHCNVSMAPLITSLAELSGARIVLDAGDTTMNGTSVEQYCVTSVARAVPEGVTLVAASGNHDSEETSAHYARAGATMLDGSVIEVDGVRILGDADPKATRVGQETLQAESYQEAGTRLSETACEDSDGVDLVLFHTPRAASTLLADGCVPAMVSGHMHSRTDPTQVEKGIQYISSSSTGAQDNEARIGPLKGTAEMTLLHFDPDERRIVDWQLIEVGTDASVTVHDPEPWPEVVDLDDEDGTGGDEGTAPDGGPTEGVPADGGATGASPDAATATATATTGG